MSTPTAASNSDSVDSAASPAAPKPSRNPSSWFSEEVYPHGAQLKSYLRSSFPTVRDVDDVVQESYLRVWKVRAQETVESARALLFTIARRVALDDVRRDRRSPVDLKADLDTLRVLQESPDAAQTAEYQENIRLLGRALALLPDRTREIVVLRKFKNISQKDVSARLGLSEAAVEHHVARGLKRCERYLRGHGIESLYGPR